MSLQIIQQAQQHTNRLAIVSQGKKYTYQQLLDSAVDVASHLLEEQQDLEEARIAFLVEPSFEYVAIAWGIWQAGGIIVPLCPLHPLPSLQYTIENSGASMLIVEDAYWNLLEPLAAEMQLKICSVETILKKTVPKSLPQINPNRRAMMLYTSGTTSLPKGVVTTHSNINFQIKTLVEAWQWTKEDYTLNVLPLHHVHGLINITSCALWVGACCEFLPKFDAATVFSLFEQGQINVFMAVPTIYFKLIAYYDNASSSEQQKLSQVLQKFRLMVSGSAALPVPVLEKWRSISGHTLLERYGMTEIGMAISNPYQGERRAGHIGQALPNVQIRLVNENGVVTNESEAGEIQIKGPNVFLEYWQKPEATTKAFTQDGWFLSGDIAILENGYYKILGRDSVDIIKSGGYKISALEIEDVLRQHPSISDCAVIGIPHPEWGEVIAACLIPKDSKNFELESLQTWLKTQLPAYKIPKHYLQKEELPKNVLGKVTKNELKKLF